MAAQSDVLRRIEAEVALVSGAAVRIERGGKHFKAVVTLATGKSQYYVFPSSKMGRRTVSNTVAGFKRMLRQMQETKAT